MQTKTFTVDIDDKQKIEETMETLLLMYKINKGKQEIQQGKFISEEKLINTFADA